MARLEVLKTYKLYIGGKFVRSESGRTMAIESGRQNIQVPLASRKDFRNSVVAARKAFSPWCDRTAFNKSQILYRIGEMLEVRKEQFIEELVLMGVTKTKATKEISSCVELCVYYSGWCDKFSSISSSVNPVSSSHFNFSIPEPMGVVAHLYNETLVGFISGILASIAGGNTCIAIANESTALSALSFSEVLNSSDVPAGVVNILSCKASSLLEHIGTHKDVNATLSSIEYLEKLQSLSPSNLKRCIGWKNQDASLEKILNFQEIKTTWHPIEKIKAKGGKY